MIRESIFTETNSCLYSRIFITFWMISFYFFCVYCDFLFFFLLKGFSLLVFLCFKFVLNVRFAILSSVLQTMYHWQPSLSGSRRQDIQSTDWRCRFSTASSFITL